MALLCLSLMSYGINLGSNFGITTISHAKKSGALFYQPSVLNISGTLVIDQEFSEEEKKL